MTTARDASTEGAFLLATDSVVVAAQKLRDTGLGSLPVLGADGELEGHLGSREIVATCVANGADPHHTQVRECATEGGPVAEADEPLVSVLRRMAELGVRRMSVVEGERFVGVLTHDAALAAADGGPSARPGSPTPR